jgi:hypothetical protein
MAGGKRLFWTAVISAVLTVILEVFVHGVMLAKDYAATATFWRPEGEINLPLHLVANILFGIFFAVIYAKGYEPHRKPVIQGMRFGALIWVLVSLAPNLALHAVSPIPGDLIWKWIAWGAFQMLFLGTFVAVAYDFKRRPAEVPRAHAAPA